MRCDCTEWLGKVCGNGRTINEVKWLKQKPAYDWYMVSALDRRVLR